MEKHWNGWKLNENCPSLRELIYRKSKTNRFNTKINSKSHFRFSAPNLYESSFSPLDSFSSLSSSLSPSSLEAGSQWPMRTNDPREHAIALQALPPQHPLRENLPRERHAISLHSFLAGTIAGGVGTVIGHPLDTLKVHAQAGKPMPGSVRGLFRGVGAPLILAGALQAANLGIYENVRRRLTEEKPCPLWAYAVAGSAAGLFMAPWLTLVNRIKVQQQLTGQSFLGTARSIRSGSALFTGLPLTFAFESTRGGYMVVYTLMKQALTKEGDNPTLWARTMAGAGANVVAWSIIYPLDVVRNVQMAHSAANPEVKAPNCVSCLRALLNEGGVSRLYRGYLFTMLRAGPVAGVILPTFEVVLPHLERLL